jgi:hypothetical protein
MIVLLDEPKNEKWGSEAAAPMFATIGREALRYLNVSPRDSSPVPIVRGEIVAGASAAPRAGGPAAPATPGAPALPVGLTPEPASAGDAQAVMPRLAGLSLRQAMETLAPFGVRLEITGRGVVTGQTPPPGSPLAVGAVCRLQLASLAGRAQAAMAASVQP